MIRCFGLKTLPFCGLALSLGFAFVLMAQNSGNPPRARVLIGQRVDPTRLYTLTGNTPSEANQQNDRGKVPDTFGMDHMLLQLRRSPERERALEERIDQQQDSRSRFFHQWLTAAELGERYGPAREDIETVVEWLRSGGFTINSVYPSRMTIDLSGTAGAVSTVFHTEIHQLSVNGQPHIANMTDPRIPEALAPVVAGIVSLHDFRPRSMRKPRAQYTTTYFGLPYYPLVPADLATIYDLDTAFTAGYTGKGQTIAVIEDSDLYDVNDWNTFRSTLGLSVAYPSGSFQTVHPTPTTGTNNCTDPGADTTLGDDYEATLDAEWASAAAPDATIVLASCSDTNATFGGLFAVQNLINSSSPPQIISISYGYCEAANGAAANAAYYTAYQQATGEGISVFVSAGDEGAASCDAGAGAATHGIGVSGFASTPYNVAVGGTDFVDTYQGTSLSYWNSTNGPTYGSAITYIPEMPWNDSCANSILALYAGFPTGYGASGFCGSDLAQQAGLFVVAGGSGGPSGCATGAPAQNLVVGGTCQGYAKPPWQKGINGLPNDGVRDLPDVSMFAANGLWGHYYVTCFTDPTPGNGGAPCVGEPINWSGAGGTSYASPVLAGIQALVNQKMGGTQGNPNPVYYKLAATSAASTIFHSITLGDNEVNCSGAIDCFGESFVGRGRSYPPTLFNGDGGLSTTTGTYTSAFPAGQGWSFATGLGSVDAYQLIANWSKGQ
jgi:subtilase family serine protease